MNISDEAVEAAAKAWFEEIGSQAYSEAMRLALDAAAPHMLGAAWELGVWAMYNTTSGEWPPIPDDNPYRSQA